MGQAVREQPAIRERRQQRRYCDHLGQSLNPYAFRPCLHDPSSQFKDLVQQSISSWRCISSRRVCWRLITTGLGHPGAERIEFGPPFVHLRHHFRPISGYRGRARSKCGHDLSCLDSANYKKGLEARAGIEPAHKGFADLWEASIPPLQSAQKPCIFNHVHR